MMLSHSVFVLTDYGYFLIPTSNENETPKGKIKHNFCSSWVVEPLSILYSSKIVCLQVDWFTRYNGIMIEH